MYTRDDFLDAIAARIGSYPTLAPLYKAGDPRILQQIGAQATMLAMLSAQIEVAQSEPFIKWRDATVLADAAMRGIIRKGTPARVSITASNSGASSFAVETGRTIMDSSGNMYRIETAATVPASGTAVFEATQVSETTLVHTVSDTVPFYAIQVPGNDDLYLAGIAVSDVDGAYLYRERYTNSTAGERIFHVEADDRQNIYVRLGMDGVVGIQPANGDEITLTISWTEGDKASPESGSPFAWEYIAAPADSDIEMAMTTLLTPGTAPISMTALRDLAKYPSVYDHNAVFLGEFDFLVRREFTSLKFLSVWNEATEELIRGASVDNINTLFVACMSTDEDVIDETALTEPVAPDAVVTLTGTQTAIKAKIATADNSYRVKFYTPVRRLVEMTINATVSTSYIATDVQAQIVAALVDEYGIDSAFAKRGHGLPNYQRVYELLRLSIPALRSERADFTVSVVGPTDPDRPELWRYVTEDSLTVTVTTANIVTSAWGG